MLENEPEVWRRCDQGRMRRVGDGRHARLAMRVAALLDGDEIVVDGDEIVTRARQFVQLVMCAARLRHRNK
jgi:hypothetical protein